MKQATLEMLCCPDCKNGLVLKEQQVSNNEIISGVLECKVCKKTFPITNNVPRLILNLGEREGLSKSWGYQWAKMAEGKLETKTYYGETEEEEINNFFKYMQITSGDLKGKRVLDAGCGCGRLTKALGKYGAQVIGIDIASSIDRIYSYCRTEPGVDIVQADISMPPFPEASFDYISCKLVLCFVQNPEQTFETLSRLVKAKGRLFVSMPDKYDKPFVIRIKSMLKVTHLVPKWLLFYICWGIAPFLWIGRRVIKKRKDSLRSNAFYLFNGLHSQFSSHSEEDIANWFKRKMFTQITVIPGMPHTVNIMGIKP